MNTQEIYSLLKYFDKISNYTINLGNIYSQNIISTVLNEESKSRELFCHIHNCIQECKDKINQLNQINEYLESFEPKLKKIQK